MDMGSFHKEIISMQSRLKGYLDKPDDSMARSLENTFQKLEDDVQVRRSPESIRNRLKDIELQMKPAYNAGVMSYEHFVEIEGWARKYQQKVR